MTIVTRRSGFAAIPNQAMRDEAISIEARGLLALMMGMGDRWTFRSKDIAKRCGVGKDKYQRMVRELKDAGYLEITAKQNEDGRLDGHDYIIHDCPDGRKTRLAGELDGEEQSHLRIPTLKNTNSKTPIPPEGDLFDPNSQQESENSKQPDPIDVGFEEFWNEIWPTHKRKTGKTDCAKVYRAACEGKHAKAEKIKPNALNAAAKRYIASVRDPEYLKGTLAWLRQPGWEPFVTKDSFSIHDLTPRQRGMLERGQCPPSMTDDAGSPNAVARYWLSEFGHGVKA